MSAKITPLPWHVSYRDWDDNHTICSKTGICVAVRPQFTSKEQFEKDAEFIVRACNSFDDLLAACEAVEHNLRQRAFGPEDVETLRAAIAKAKGKRT